MSHNGSSNMVHVLPGYVAAMHMLSAVNCEGRMQSSLLASRIKCCSLRCLAVRECVLRGSTGGQTVIVCSERYCLAAVQHQSERSVKGQGCARSTATMPRAVCGFRERIGRLARH